MVLNYEVTVDDYLAYNMFFYKESAEVKKPVLWFRIVFVVLALVNAASWMAGGDVRNLVMLIVSCFMVAFARKIALGAVRRSVLRLVKGDKVDEFIGRQKLELLGDVIRWGKSGEKRETAYANVRKIERDEERLYVFTGGMTAFIVPAGVFQDEAEKEKFIDMINEKRGSSLKDNRVGDLQG